MENLQQVLSILTAETQKPQQKLEGHSALGGPPPPLVLHLPEDNTAAPECPSTPKGNQGLLPTTQSPLPPLPLESRLEDHPDPSGREESSADSLESEGSLSGGSSGPTAERAPPPAKTLDTSLNFRLGLSGAQVTAQYSTDPSPPAVETPLVIPRQLAVRLASSEVGALAEFQALATPEPPALSSASSQSMALEYTPAQLDSSRANLEVCAGKVGAYMVDHGEGRSACIHPSRPPCPYI